MLNKLPYIFFFPQVNYKPGYENQDSDDNETSANQIGYENDGGRDEDDPDDNKYKTKKKASVKLPTWYSLIILTYCFCVFGLVWHMDGRLPTPMTKADLAEFPESFIEERARDYLKKLTSVGARPAGNEKDCKIKFTD